MANPVKFLVLLLVYALVMYAAWLIVGLFPLPPNIGMVVVTIIAILLLLSLLRQTGWGDPPNA